MTTDAVSVTESTSDESSRGRRLGRGRRHSGSEKRGVAKGLRRVRAKLGGDQACDRTEVSTTTISPQRRVDEQRSRSESDAAASNGKGETP